MQNRLIDCSTFLLLTGAELGKYGDYWIEEEGVRGNIDTTPERLHLSESCEQARLLAFNRDARLRFPVTVRGLIQWSKKQDGNVPVPAWLLEVAKCDSPARARAVLVKTKRLLERKVSKEYRSSLSLEAKAELGFDMGELIGELDAVAYLIELVNEGDCENGEPSGERNFKRERYDVLTREILEARRQLSSDASAAAVMKLLQSWAGKPHCCIAEAIPEGLLWKRSVEAHADLEKLTMPLLRKRLSRIGSRHLKLEAGR